MATKLIYSTLSEQGMRDNNEDIVVAQAINDNLSLFVCLDGCGGEEGGEAAASIAANTIKSYFSGIANIGLEDLKMAVITANNNIIDMQINPRISHMSCVLTACIVDMENGCMHLCHVGDTRLYVLDDTETLRKLTPDHSWVGKLLDNGQITEEEARKHKRRNIISRALGLQRLDFFSDYIFTKTMPIADIKQILLCSDGVYDAIPSQIIQSILCDSDTTEDIVRSLINTALKMRSHDNLSAISIKLPI